MIHKKPTIIGITGTKGKTTVSNILNNLLQEKKTDVLLVDTEGVYVNNQQKESFNDSWHVSNLVPTVCPGRFLYHLQASSRSTAILELSIGSSNLPGMGYRDHAIGVFLNVFEDHIGVRVKSRKDLALHKARMIFKRISKHGYAVFNADDKYITKNLTLVNTKKEITLVPFGIRLDQFDHQQHTKQGGIYITVQDNWIVARDKKNTEKLIDVTKVLWTFDGNYQPSIYNLLAIISTLYAHRGMKKPSRAMLKKITETAIPEEKARLLRLKNTKKKYDIIVDYAHEKYSIIEISKLAKMLSTGKTIGLVRFSHDRTDAQLMDYARAIANTFDIIIVYNRAIQFSKKKPLQAGLDKVQHAADLVFKEIQKNIKKPRIVERAQDERSAIQMASKLVAQGDVIVHISNKHDHSIMLVKKYLL
ncbi:MAG: hypothetical protein KBC22_03205 [Candidatus Pacebacteria bacterium]|nr:hypothetical protein [Candidatus Paceibacterota bacterium]